MTTHSAPDDLVALGPSDRVAWRVGERAVDLVRPIRRPRPFSLNAAPKSITIDLSRTAIVVIDMQNDFCHPNGWLGSIGVDVTPARKPIEPLRTILPVLRRTGMPVVWVNWGARPDRANLSPSVLHVYNGTGRGFGIADPLPKSGDPVLTEGSWAAAVVDELTPEAGDISVSKHRMSGFWDTPLDQILRNLDVTTLLFAGVNADQCVLHTLADANFLGYDTIMLENCSATTSPSYCWDATVYNVKTIFGFTAQSTDLLALRDL